MPSETLFISDLHLTPSRGEVISLFLTFLENRASNSEALYILGDLFEYWIGDDDRQEGLTPVLDGLQSLTQHGVPVYFIAGNRDFLIGEEFALRTGCILLDDMHRMELAGQAALLMHGDTLCTDDNAYQKLRTVLRNEDWQRGFLSLPIQERRSQAEALRTESHKATHSKSEEIMDVNNDTVNDCFRTQNITLLIHGHTHRPGLHESMIDNRKCTRLVLGDWYTQGSLLSVSSHGTQLETLALSN